MTGRNGYVKMKGNVFEMDLRGEKDYKTGYEDGYDEGMENGIMAERQSHKRRKPSSLS